MAEKPLQLNFRLHWHLVSKRYKNFDRAPGLGAVFFLSFLLLVFDTRGVRSFAFSVLSPIVKYP